MPDLADGLEQAVASDLDVNSTAGFNAAVAGLAGVEVPEGALDGLSDTDVASGLTTHEESASPRRDPETGRFTSRQPESPAAQEGAAPEEGQEGEEQLDPELATLLERHGGDPVAALRALQEEARNAQSLIGRHSVEVGELRQQLARLEGRVEQASRAPQQPAPILTADQLVDLVADRGGRQAVIELVQRGADDATIERAFQTWAEYDDTPYEALAARQDYRLAVSAHDARPAQQEPAVDPTLAEIKRERQMGMVIATVKGQMQPAEWAVVKDHLIPAFEDDSTPEIIKNAVVSDDQQTQLQGISALVQLARGRAIAAATAQASQERTAQLTQSKRVAAVGSGSLRPVQKRQPEEAQSREERIKSFHEALLRTETTSVAEGLTTHG